MMSKYIFKLESHLSFFVVGIFVAKLSGGHSQNCSLEKSVGGYSLNKNPQDIKNPQVSYYNFIMLT